MRQGDSGHAGDDQQELFVDAGTLAPARPALRSPEKGLQKSLDELLARLDLAASPAGITRVGMRRRNGGLMRRVTGTIGRLLDQARQELREYLAGQRTFFRVPVDLGRVPSFERAALDVANSIPYGEVRTYRWIAETLGQPGAARAVGRAMAMNPVPILLPCHRVVRTDGGLGGYSCGLIRKEALLSLERTTVPYIGCASARILCRRGCEAERRIGEGDRVHFATAAQARASGYRPCTVCAPSPVEAIVVAGPDRP